MFRLSSSSTAAAASLVTRSTRRKAMTTLVASCDYSNSNNVLLLCSAPKSTTTTTTRKRMTMNHNNKRSYHSSSINLQSDDNTKTIEKKFYHSSSLNLDDYATTTTSSNVSGGGVYPKISFIGTGMMAQAMIAPLINTGLQPSNQVILYDVINSRMKSVASNYDGVVMADSLQEAVKDVDLVVLCVKPQNMNEGFFNELNKVPLKDNATLLSIAAGVPLSTFSTSTNFDKIVRSMPNTPAQIGQGITVWCSTQNMTSAERDKVKQVLNCLGKTIYVDDEKHVDMSTSISGSGPAYIFMLMEAMIDAGVHMGFPRDQATTLVYQTLLGSTLYAMETGEHPAILRNSVTSPSGTTASALYELENGKFRTVIKDAMWACYERSIEMGEDKKPKNGDK